MTFIARPERSSASLQSRPGAPLTLAALIGVALLGCAKTPEGSKISGSDQVPHPLDGTGGSAVIFGTGGTSNGGGAPGASGNAGTSQGGAGVSTGPEAGVSGCGQPIEGLGACGAQTVAAHIRHPHMLIVLDKSGSTSDQPTGFNVTIWEGLKAALTTALDAAKDRVSFGLELFPFPSDPTKPIATNCDQTECCQMPTTADMTVPIENGVTAVPKIIAALNATGPSGGTPTAAALKRAYDYFTTGPGAALDGEKFVMLATDGGPNCNATLQCDATGCTTNLEGYCTGGNNCCAGAGVGCVDDQDTIAQIQALRDKGINTFVVGIPGSEAYSRYLDQFAVTGNQVNPSAPPSYYKVDAAAGVAGLTSVFSAITTQLVTSCEIDLATPPPNPREVNVALNCQVVPHSGTTGTDGWVLDTTSDPSTITLQGNLCRWVQQQGVDRVDIIFGCPTVR
jgi:hypothetical protein